MKISEARYETSDGSIWCDRCPEQRILAGRRYVLAFEPAGAEHHWCLNESEPEAITLAERDRARSVTVKLDRATYVALMDVYDVEITALQVEQRGLQRYADEYRLRGEARNLGSALSALRAAEQAEDLLATRQRSAAGRLVS